MAVTIKDKNMKHILIAALVLGTLGPQLARADDGAASEAPASAAAASSLSWNAAVVSDYRYRGISQTRLRPALQGGVDAVDGASGWYAGAWASTIAWTADAGGSGHVELDLYGGKRGTVTAELVYDLGLLGYVYPSNGLGAVAGFANANTLEAYGQLSYGSGSLKYSHSLSNLFGFVDSHGSGYLDLSVNPAIGAGLQLNLHLGHQRVANNGAASYSDWKLGLTRDFGFVSAALAALGTDAGKAAYASPANGKFLGKTALQLTLSRTF